MNQLVKFKTSLSFVFGEYANTNKNIGGGD
jgi:hypothetical protein